jgi:hypothetical protein
LPKDLCLLRSWDCMAHHHLRLYFIHMCIHMHIWIPPPPPPSPPPRYPAETILPLSLILL